MTADYANCFVLVDFAEIIISKSSAKYRDMKFYVEKQLEWSHTATTTTTAWNEMDLKLIQTESTLWFYRNEEKNHFLRQFTFRTSTMCSNWTPKWFMSHATWNIRQMKLSAHKEFSFEHRKKRTSNSPVTVIFIRMRKIWPHRSTLKRENKTENKTCCTIFNLWVISMHSNINQCSIRSEHELM